MLGTFEDLSSDTVYIDSSPGLSFANLGFLLHVIGLALHCMNLSCRISLLNMKISTVMILIVLSSV